jgi:zinc-ribbon domain
LWCESGQLFDSLKNGVVVIYSGDLPSGQKLYLENQGEATIVTILMQQSGQQQQSGSSFVTGVWQSPPEIFASAQGAIVRVMTASGVWGLMVQGMSLAVQSGSMPVGDEFRPVGLTPLAQMPHQSSQQQSNVGFDMPPMQPMTPMQPMAPMQPMTMGNMSMNASPMQMQMGNMGMTMGQPISTVSSSSQTTVNATANANASASANANAKTAKFCSQCGSGLAEGAKFCSSCGHQVA